MTSVNARLAGLVAAALAAAAGLVGLSSGPAAAALCSGSGVNVVVDFNGGSGRSGVEKGCDPGGANRSADKVFPAAGFPLTYAQREPGFVCRVKNAPTSDPCGNASPTNAYWGLFWSNGKSGKWSYASSGVGGTSVPNGGFIAFAWQNGGGRDWPSASPVRSTQASTPKPQPTKQATTAPTRNKATKQSDTGSGSTSAEAPEEVTAGQPTKTQGAAGASPQKKKAVKANRARASDQAKAKARAKASPSASARSSASASAAADPSDEASPDVTSAKPVDSAFAPEQEQDGLPVWVPVLVVLALAGAAGGTAWWRRRTGAP